MDKDKKQTQQTTKHHYIRTSLAVLFGVVAFWLVTLGVVTVWVNRAVTDTNTYVNTVEPLSKRSEVKDFIIEKVDEQLQQSASGLELANLTLPDALRSNKTDSQLKAASIVVINKTITRVIDSDAFQKLWVSTNRTAHQQLVTQLESNSDEATFDMGPTITGVVTLLKDTQLAPLVDRLKLPSSDKFTITLQSQNLASARNAYKLFKQGTILLIVIAVACLALAVTLSVHHVTTLRRILIGSGIGLLLIWLAVMVAPSKIATGSDQSSKALIEAVATVLLRDLRLITLIAGITFVLIGVASELYDVAQARKSKKA